MKKIAIIGASELQNPLIEKAHQMGLETHVFAWKVGDIGESTADFFYPISITETDAIEAECRRIGIDGICTIASDLANVTVGAVSHHLGLPGNSPACVYASTNKQAMRACFAAHGDPSPRSIPVHAGETPDLEGWAFPLIVKPIDRSGSRGVTRLDSIEGLEEALSAAFESGFQATALIEEYAQGDEYSFEFCSFEGTHHLLAATKKFTTGAPHFIEMGHMEPSGLSPATLDAAQRVLSHALDSLEVQTGASHAEMKIDSDGTMNIIEIGSRMGGDCIGSDLVPLTTGIDFTRAVIDCALGRKPNLTPAHVCAFAVVKYLFNQYDLDILASVSQNHPKWIVRSSSIQAIDHEVSDSSTRFGFFVMALDNEPDLAYLELK